MITQQIQAIRCAWCNHQVDPTTVRRIAVREDPLDAQLVTGEEPVCNGCLETNRASYRVWWWDKHSYEYIER